MTSAESLPNNIEYEYKYLYRVSAIDDVAYITRKRKRHILRNLQPHVSSTMLTLSDAQRYGTSKGTVSARLSSPKHPMV